MLREQCQELSQYIIEMRRKFHRIPELGIHLPQSQAIICEELDKMGIPYKKNTVMLNGVQDSSVIGFIEGASTDKVIALRADFDGLPVTEETGESFASTIPGQMHACGHDVNPAMLLGAAKVLSQNKHLLKGGSVKLFFQSAEEITTGARLMIEGGAMENPDVTAVFGIHIDPMGDKGHKCGAMVVMPGCVLASGDRFAIRIKGKVMHGAHPQRGLDAIMVAAQLLTALQVLVTREVPGDSCRVLSLCQIHGGSSWNSLAEEVVMEGTLRTMDYGIQDTLKRRIEEVTAGICATWKTEGAVEWIDGTPPVVNHPDMQKLVSEAGKKILGEDYIIESYKGGMSCEDVAHFMARVPGLFALLNTSSDDPETWHSWHSPKLRVAEDILWHGAALHVQTVVDYLAE